MKDCIFCKIIANEIPSEKLYEDKRMIIIRDISPKAAVHLLAIPKKHYADFSLLDAEAKAELGEIFFAIAQNAQRLGYGDGYRLIINKGLNGGQTVFHLHIHILGGQVLPFEKL